MVNIYDRLRDENGMIPKGRTKLFVKDTGVADIREFKSGIALVPEESGWIFIVDEYLVNQIDKLQIANGELTVKEGMSIQERIKTPGELRMEELERELNLLKQNSGAGGPSQ